jgi:hypothetical protein
MNDVAVVYTVRVWRQAGGWRMAVRPAGEERLLLFTRTEEISAFFTALTVPVGRHPVAGAAPEPAPALPPGLADRP